MTSRKKMSMHAPSARSTAGRAGLPFAVLPVFTPIAAFGLIVAHAANIGSTKLLLALAVLLLFTCVPICVRTVRLRSHRAVLVALFAVSILIQCVPEFFRWDSLSFYEIGWRTVYVLSGWACVLCALRPRLWPAPPGTGGCFPIQLRQANITRSCGRVRRALPVLSLLAAATVLLLVAHFAIRERYAIVIDEVVYVFQAHHFSSPGFGMQLSPSLARFFILRQSFYAPNLLLGQYPPRLARPSVPW